MDFTVGLYLVVGLVIALALARHVAKVRKQRRRLRRAARQAEPEPRAWPARKTDRAEMRAYDDPSTLADGMTTRSRGGEKRTTREKQ